MSQLVGLVLEHADDDAAGVQPGGRGAGQLDDVPPAGVHGEQDAAGLVRRSGCVLPGLLAGVLA